MLKINMEFKKGILFIRLDGSFNKKTVKKFDNEVLPIILMNKVMYVVINLDKVYLIDKEGVESLMELENLVRDFKGKTTLCGLTSNYVKTKIEEADYDMKFYETNNELTALKVMKI